MKKIFLPLAYLCLSVLFSACQEITPEDPVFKVLDSEGATVLSLEESLEYDGTYSYYKYLDISSPDLTNEQMPSPKFLVQSNLSWRLVPAEDYDWVHPFPDCGEEDGLFYFVIDRSTDQHSTRTAEYRMIANNGIQDIAVGGVIRLTQDQSNEFLRKSAARIEFSKSSGKKDLLLTTNIPWEYSLSPDPDYATESLDWITCEKKTSRGGIVDTLHFSVSENPAAVRAAILTLRYTLNETVVEEPFTVLQNGESVEVEGFPIRWKIGVADHNFTESWPAEGVIEAEEGNGQIRYVSIDKSTIDVSKNFRLDINSNDPRVIGVWPGDYCEFTSPIPVAKGTILKISFEPRVSASCMKYWRLEYKDGNEWKIAGTPQTTMEPGMETIYTVAFTGGANAAANAQVSTVVKYENTTDKVDFRLLCVANWTCSGAALEAPNGASWRLTLSDRSSETWWPTIQCIAGGTESIVAADLKVTGATGNLLVFEGTPEDDVALKVLSDNPFTVSSDVSWLHIDPAEGPAGVETEVNIHCDNSDLSKSRQGTIDIQSGITHYTIKVVQSAAGQELQPFISIVGGNSRTVRTPAGSFDVQVQTNVPVAVEAPDWIQVEEVVPTKSVVDYRTWTVRYGKNETGDTRIGRIRFYNSDYGIESVMTLTQVVLEVTLDKTEAYLLPGEQSAEFTVTSNVEIAAEVAEGTATLSKTLLSAGTDKLGVTLDGDGTARIRLFNEENDYESFITVSRYSVLGNWKFGSADASAVKASWNSSESELQGIGAGDKYVRDALSDGNRLTYYNGVDKADGAISAKYKFSRATANNGDPYIKSPFAGDYWLYTMPCLKQIPAGTKIHFQFFMRNSGAGNRYWAVEFLDGDSWAPALDLQQTTVGETEIQYNFDIGKDSAYIPCSGTFTTRSATETLQVRVRAVVNWTIKGAAFTELNGSTSRMGADGKAEQNHLFEIVQ